MSKLPLAALSVVVSLSACAVPFPPPAPRGDLLADSAPSGFGAADALLSGIGPRETAAGIEKGDRCLFGVRFHDGDDERRWLLEFEVLDGERTVTRRKRDGTLRKRTVRHCWTVYVDGKQCEVDSSLCEVRVRVLAENGTELASSQMALPADFLAMGFAAVGTGAWTPGTSERGPSLDGARTGPDKPPEVAAGPMIALTQFLGFVQDDKVLAPYFWQVVQKPSLWSVIRNLGVRATLRIEEPVPVDPALGPEHLAHCGDRAVLPLIVDVNGDPALYCHFLVGSAVAPLTPVGGILGASGMHPCDRERRFELVLLAAQRANARSRGVMAGGEAAAATAEPAAALTQ